MTATQNTNTKRFWTETFDGQQYICFLINGVTIKNPVNRKKSTWLRVWLYIKDLDEQDIEPATALAISLIKQQMAIGPLIDD